MRSSRVEYIDVARGLTIIMMICFHVLGETITMLHHFFATSVVFVFIVSSGYFSEKTDVPRLVKKLVLPYYAILWIVRIIWWIRMREFRKSDVTDVLYQMLIGRTIDGLWPGFSLFVGIAWFLPLLFTIRIIYALIRKVTGDRFFIRVILCVALFILGVYVGRIGIRFPWYLGEAMAAIPFFCLGEFMNRYSEGMQKFLSYYPVAIPVFLAWWFMVRMFGYGELPNYGNYEYGMLWVAISALAVLFVFMVSFFLSTHLSHVSDFLQFYGRNLLPVYMMHVIDKSCITGPTDFNIYLLFVIELLIASLPLLFKLKRS